MALAQINTAVPWPGVITGLTTAISVSNGSTLDAAGEYEALIFCAREAMTISHVAFRNASATGAPTADIRIETVDASGLPSGTLWATNTNIVTGTLTTGWQGTFALTASASIAAGQIACIKIAYNSGTSFIPNVVGGGIQSNGSLPYRVLNTGTPTKTVAGSVPSLAVGNSSTTFYYVRGLSPVITVTATNFNNGTAGDKRGLRFQVPFTGRLVGLRLYNGAATGDYNIAAYNDAGTQLSSSSTAFDGDQTGLLTTGTCDTFFDNPVTLSAATWYRVAIEPSSATNTTFQLLTLSTANYFSAMPHGTNAMYTTYTTVGGWDDSATTQVPAFDLLFDQLSNISSGGSGGNPIIGG